MKLMIVSGLSGAGKSAALATLEDSNFYCLDNIPLRWLRTGLQDLWQSESADSTDSRYENIAIGIDARGFKKDLAQFAEDLAHLHTQNIRPEILFLTADDEVLIKRFHETRRVHPLNPKLPLKEAIAQERAVLAPIMDMANHVIDTSRTNIYDLRHLVRKYTPLCLDQTTQLTLLSFGFKHGIPEGADFVFDVRALPNPHWDENLRDFSGLDAPVQDFLNEYEEVGEMRSDIARFLRRWLPECRAQQRAYLTAAIGCTGGKHRSVFLVESLAQALRDLFPDLTVRHLNLKQ